MSKIKNILSSRYALLALIGVVCVALVVITIVSVASGDDPDQGSDSVMQSPDPTPEPPPVSTPSTPEPVPEQTPEPTPDPTPEPPPEPTSTNPLTGMPMAEELIRNRPIAVSMGNQTDAQPMNGISAADILYEMPVEGVTRMIGIFQDTSNVPKIGSIRSARHYTVQIAESHDAILVHVGGSPLGLKYISDRRVTNLDETPETSPVIRRDNDRVPGQRMARPNNTVLLGERLTDWLPERSFRITHGENFDLGLSFTDDGIPQNGDNAAEVIVRFESGKTSTFKYNADRETYSFNQYNTNVIDANDNSHPAFTNLLIIRTSISTLQGEGSGAGRRQIITTGSGEGYFVCGGKYVEINWHREDTKPFRYTFLDGTEVELGRGRTYIGIVPTGAEQIFN